MEIFFPHDKFLDGLFSTPASNQKNPPENACTLPNNHYYM